MAIIIVTNHTVWKIKPAVDRSSGRKEFPVILPHSESEVDVSGCGVVVQLIELYREGDPRLNGPNSFVIKPGTAEGLVLKIGQTRCLLQLRACSV